MSTTTESPTLPLTVKPGDLDAIKPVSIPIPKPDPKVINDPLREKLALIAFREMVSHQLKTKFDYEQIMTQTWRFADWAMRGKGQYHRATISVAGIVGDVPPAVPLTIDEAMQAITAASELPPIEEIK